MENNNEYLNLYESVKKNISPIFHMKEHKQEIEEFMKKHSSKIYELIDYIQTLNYCVMDLDKSSYSLMCNEVCNKYFNNVFVCLNILKEGLYDEFLIMLRQNIEISTLLSYFNENTDLILPWIKGELPNNGYIPPYERRKSNPKHKKLLDKHYRSFSDYTHTKSSTFGTAHVGGFYDPRHLNQKFFLLYFYMFLMIENLIERIEFLEDNDSESILNDLHSKENLTEKELLLLGCLYKYADIVNYELNEVAYICGY